MRHPEYEKDNVLNILQKETDAECERTKVYDWGLSGYWYTANYGAALTGYALNSYIRYLGYSVLMIDLPDFQFVGKDEYRDETSPTRKFIRKNCSVSKIYRTEEELEELNNLCKGFVLGSDQLWNWRKNRYREEGGFYLLDYVTGDKKKVAYGTSFGTEGFDGTNEDKINFGFMLRRFSKVSVREKCGVDITSNLFGVEATVVVDPVFLLNKSDYMKLVPDEPITVKELPKKFLLLYLLQPTEEKLAYAHKAAEKLGLDIVAVSDLDPDYMKYAKCSPWEMDYFDRIEVEDWLCLMNKAEFVITDSYHGFCFSLIFHKQFVALKPRGELNRFYTVADMPEMEERICLDLETDGNCFDILKKQVLYDKIDKHLTNKIENSKIWIKNALEDNVGDYQNIDVYDVARFMMKRLKCEAERNLREMEEAIKSEISTMKRQVITERYWIVKHVLEKLLKGKKVAIRCAGIHTRELLKLISKQETVKCIWDTNTNNQEFCGYPCITEVEHLKDFQIDTILISSYKYRHEIKKELLHLSEDYEVIELYEELEKEGVAFDSEFYWF